MNPGRLHILTDVRLQQRHTAVELARMAFDGGADVVQYREKLLAPAQMHAEVQALMRLPRQAHQRVIVNDHVQLAAEAQGVHLGQEDMAPQAAAAMLSPHHLIGATVHTLEELEALRGAPIHYIGVGPVFGTASKQTGLPPLGLEGLSRICQQSPWPVIAIGSITVERTPEVLAAGAHGVAVISAFCLHPDPRSIAERFAHILA